MKFPDVFSSTLSAIYTMKLMNMRFFLFSFFQIYEFQQVQVLKPKSEITAKGQKQESQHLIPEGRNFIRVINSNYWLDV